MNILSGVFILVSAAVHHSLVLADDSVDGALHGTTDYAVAGSWLFHCCVVGKKICRLFLATLRLLHDCVTRVKRVILCTRHAERSDVLVVVFVDDIILTLQPLDHLAWSLNFKPVAAIGTSSYARD